MRFHLSGFLSLAILLTFSAFSCATDSDGGDINVSQTDVQFWDIYHPQDSGTADIATDTAVDVSDADDAGQDTASDVASDTSDQDTETGGDAETDAEEDAADAGQKLPTPLITPAQGTYYGPEQLKIECPGFFGATIYYTLEGSTPTYNSTRYPGVTIPLDQSHFGGFTIKARAYQEYFIESDVAANGSYYFYLGSKGIEDKVKWNKMIDEWGLDDIAYSIQNCSNQIIVGGSREFNEGNVNGSDWWITLFDSDTGDITQDIPCPNCANGSNIARSLACGPNTGEYIYAAGIENTNWGFQNQVGWTRKFNGVGGWIMEKEWIGETNSGINAILSDENGQYLYAVGYNRSTYDNWRIIKFNTITLIPLWQKTFNGTGDARANAIAKDPVSGLLYVAGYGTFGQNGTDWWIKRFTANGIEDTIDWNLKIDGGYDDDEAKSIAIDSFGYVYVGGYGTFANGVVWWIKKFDFHGQEISQGWNKKIGTSGDEILHALSIDNQGNLYAIGYGTNLLGTTGKDWWLKKFDLHGNEDRIQWNLSFDGYMGGEDEAIGIHIDSNKIYIAGYGTNLLMAVTHKDWWIKMFQ